MPLHGEIQSMETAYSKKNSPTERLVSIDAYRGFVMLAMASGGLGLGSVLSSQPDLAPEGTLLGNLLRGAAYQMSHVAWQGCAFWDLIQPSFMFLVGTSLAFSVAKREKQGQDFLSRFGHALLRSLILVLLGVFLISNNQPMTSFSFVNVLTQIGLGYPFLFLLAGRDWRVQAVGLMVVLGLSFALFTFIPPTPASISEIQEYQQFRKMAVDVGPYEGRFANWNKHVNVAAAADRVLLNFFPWSDAKAPVFHDRQFWINEGGYQTLNFLPSLATMILGLLAGGWLRTTWSVASHCVALIGSGFLLLLLGIACDPAILPISALADAQSLCPIVKRIWTPSWMLFSGGWSLLMLGGFHLVIEAWGARRWAFPLVVVGSNSIAIYVMSQLLGPWVDSSVKTHLTAFDAATGWALLSALTGGAFWPVWRSLLRLTFYWLVCWYLYISRIFIKI